MVPSLSTKPAAVPVVGRHAVRASATQSLSGTDLPLREAVAQIAPPSAPRPGGLAPGLYVQVIDGLISLMNKGGSQSFSAGQFGFVRAIIQPPVMVPTNPGLQVNPPPAFNSSSGPRSSVSGGEAAAVDCEVR